MTLLADSKSQQKKSSELDESRFTTAKTTLLIDRFMTHFIKIGGISVIAAVLGICLFIFLQILPLFRGAKVHEKSLVTLPAGDYLALGADEWGELPFVAERSGKVQFINTADGKVVQSYEPALPEGIRVTAKNYSIKEQELYLGTSAGSFAKLNLNYKPVFKNGERTITASPSLEDPIELKAGLEVVQIDYADAGEIKMVAALLEGDSKKEVHAVTLEQEQTLFGAGDVEISDRIDLTSFFRSEPTQLLVSSQADNLVVATESGDIYYFVLDDGEAELRQVFQPFQDLKDNHIASMGFIFGDVSLSLTNPQGINRILSLYIHEGDQQRTFGQTKSFENLPGVPTYFHASVRNKAFLLGTADTASLRYSTTETIRWQKKLPFKVSHAILSSKYNEIYMLDTDNRLHVYDLEDEHPEAGFKAFFGKIWYEGYSEPSYDWQSTGGTDDFEPKLSIIPLMIGTLKGTFYALIFALPIALLAAVYTSQFAEPKVRTIIKPTMEIMAALPSVVLGFLAALWLAPVLETKVPSLLTLLVFIPLTAVLFGYYWTKLPIQTRSKIKPGNEWIAFVPMLLVVSVFGWHAGEWLEKVIFVVTNPETGVKTADFRLWWHAVTGTTFEQRNSLVVGFIMGFAVIPIIFTIAEDALSNVPKALRAGSLALGASRWQTVWRVILPTALPGIFSAAMIGFGRAIGETMIVVMATGNTPIMSFNIFNGFRTLSANIAVELPEAPYLGTLYRSLFLGAFVLFVLTFIVNSFAEVIRQHLREKYKTV